MAVYNRKMFVNAPQQMKLNSRGTGIGTLLEGFGSFNR